MNSSGTVNRCSRCNRLLTHGSKSECCKMDHRSLESEATCKCSVCSFKYKCKISQEVPGTQNYKPYPGPASREQSLGGLEILRREYELMNSRRYPTSYPYPSVGEVYLQCCRRRIPILQVEPLSKDRLIAMSLEKSQRAGDLCIHTCPEFSGSVSDFNEPSGCEQSIYEVD